MRNSGKRAAKLMSQIKEFQNARERGEMPIFFGDDFVIIDRTKLTRDMAGLLNALMGMVDLNCKYQSDNADYIAGTIEEIQAFRMLEENGMLDVTKMSESIFTATKKGA